MIEAAVAHHEVTGKRSLLNVAMKLADCIVRRFSEGEGLPGHQEIELALMRLYSATGEEKYLDMAVRFLDRRGQDPNYFRENTPPHPGRHFFSEGAEDEHPERDPYSGYDIDPDDADYNQTYAPVRAQTEARGHAVRMMYMLTAMADAAEVCGDEGLGDTCAQLFEHIVQRQMYVTGGLGGTARGEAFLPDFQLPNDTAYAETCASVAMAFFCQSMLNLNPDARYADILELELYSSALSGISLDGTRYFYVNPLEVMPGVSGVAPGHEHVLPERQAWMSCACCPPNLARLIASLGGYLWSEGDSAIYSHLFIGSRAHTALADVELSTGYPWRGGAQYILHPRVTTPFALHIRVPGYVGTFRTLLNGSPITAPLEQGYLKLERHWRDGDRVTQEFELEPRRLYADARVKTDVGCVALARGPFVYCFEGADNLLPPAHSAPAHGSRYRDI